MIEALCLFGLLAAIVAIVAISDRRQDPSVVVIDEEAARRARALAYAQRMGNCHGHWGGAAGRPPY